LLPGGREGAGAFNGRFPEPAGRFPAGFSLLERGLLELVPALLALVFFILLRVPRRMADHRCGGLRAIRSEIYQSDEI
jgi:hypothetical protein